MPPQHPFLLEVIRQTQIVIVTPNGDAVALWNDRIGTVNGVIARTIREWRTEIARQYPNIPVEVQ